jgi:CheY-like chemotaxis protein
VLANQHLASHPAMTPRTDLPVIVVADDDAAHRLLTVKAFQRSGLRNPIQEVQDGEELMEFLLAQGRYQAADNTTPMIVLLDLNMPRKSGLEALAEIKAHPRLRRIPVIVLTTSGEDRDIVRSYDLGANSLISKPVDFGEFSEVIRRLGGYWLELVAMPRLDR